MENNLKYKHKYFKYKFKYLELKNICESDTNYSIYNPQTNQCCNTRLPFFKKCIQKQHTINYTKIPNSDLLTDFKKNYKFEEGNYISQDWNGVRFETFLKTPDNITFSYIKTIGSGGYGNISQYADTNGNYIVVKYGNVDKDKEIIEIIKNNNNLCSELVVKYIVGDTYIIMENANGTIDELIPVIQDNIKLCIDVLYAIIIAIQCLRNINLYYTDIKMENILYRYTQDGIEIILADLGGITYESTNDLTATYFPYERTLNIYKSVQNKYDSIISWGIGMLVLNLLGMSEHSNSLSEENMPPYDLIELDKYVTSIIDTTIIPELQNKKYNDIITLIKFTLCPYNKRWSLSRIIDFINDFRIQ